jgi:hypothetical protein
MYIGTRTRTILPHGCVGAATLILAMLSLPVARSQDAPAGATAQTPAGAPGPSSSARVDPAAAAAAPQPARPAKKVWTNDDLGSFRSGSSDPAAAASKSNAKPAPAASKTKPQTDYRAQIEKLQAQLPPIDSQIADLQAAISGATVNDTRKYTGVKPDSWPAQLTQLQQKRDEIESQIEALRDDARRNGVPANSLP